MDEGVKITAVAYGGKGVCHIDGKVHFVTDALPGDEVSLEVTKDNKNFAEANVVEYLQKNKMRRSSACPISKECGGCQWQEAPYREQMQWKKSFLTDALERIAGLKELPRLKEFASATTLEYRNRIQLRVHTTPGEPFKLGFFKTGTRDLAPLEGCPIAEPMINDVIAKLRELALDIPAQKFRIELQSFPLLRQVSAVITPADPKVDGLEEVVAQIKTWPQIAWAGQVFDLKDAPEFLLDQQNGLDYYTRPGMFQQVNRLHNHKLRTLVHGWVDELAPKTILDLFCGSGNLSLGLADGTRKVVGLEFNPSAIEVAQRNVEVNNLTKLEFVAGDADKYLQKNKTKFKLVIVDPPRQGLLESAESLIELRPKNLIYISCDPNTFARDIKKFTASGYTLEKLACFDFFPNTFHIESVGLLTLQGK